MNVICRVLVDVRLLEHLIRQINELLCIELLAYVVVLGHVMEERENLLTARISRCLVLLLKLTLHEQIENLGFILHVNLVVGIF